MKKGKVYKHVHAKDAAFYVTSTSKTSGMVVAIGYWVIATTAQSPRLLAQDKIKVAVKELDKWKEISL